MDKNDHIPLTIQDIKAGKTYKLVPYGATYQIVFDFTANNVQEVYFEIINLNCGVTTFCTHDKKELVKFLNHWLAVEVPNPVQ